MARRAVLVLGMHRSGTSAVTGLLVRLGARAPKTLMQPTEHNPLGFWESDALFEYHERLLHTAGSEWDDWTRVTVDDLDPTTVSNFADECRALLSTEFGEAPFFVVKDPRICRFVPFWLRSLAADGIEAVAVITLRSPLEVAQSLAERDGLGLEHALMLWLRHMLDAEWETRAIPRSFIRFQDLLIDWKPLARRMFDDLALEWPEGSDASDAEIAAFLRSDLRHHAIALEHLSVPEPLQGWVTLADTAFSKLLTKDPQSTRDALSTLDDVRREVDQFSVVFGPVFSDMRRANRQRAVNLEAELRRQVSTLEAERDQLRQHVLDREAECDRLREWASSLDAELTELRPHASRLAAERDQLALKLEQDRRQGALMVKSLSERLAQSDSHVRLLLQSRSWRWAAPLRAAFRVWLKVSGRETR